MTDLNTARTNLEQQLVDGAPNTITPSKLRQLIIDLVDALASKSSPFSKVDATTSPTVNDDGVNSSGNGSFETGSKWYNQVDDEVYLCLINTTGAAVWVPITLSLDDLGSAAVLNAGTGANQVVQLDAQAKLPPVDGSRLTNIGAAVTSGTLDQFADGADGENVWHTSGRELRCQGKRAMVGFSTADGNVLAVNYAEDFEWLDLYGKHKNSINIERDWPGLQLKPTVPGGFGYIDFIKDDRPNQDFHFRLRTDASSEQIVFEHYDVNDVYSHTHSLTGEGNVWTKSYGWLHDKFADQNGQQVAKAWASIDGNGTFSVNDSYGFSSVSDMGTGKYRCTFSTARPNANYCAHVSSGDRNGHGKGGPYIREQTTTYVEVGINRTGIGHMDEDIINIVVFGD